MYDVLNLLKNKRKFFLTVGAPIVLSALPIYWKDVETGREPYAAMVILMMSTYWMTECLPLAVTSLLPIVFYPLFGILSSERVSNAYLQDSILFLLGGCIIALAFEYSNLHARIALKIIMLVGAGISQLLLGVMFTTMFLSMWMNNMSTTAMMIPIVNAIIQQLEQETSRRNSLVTGLEESKKLAIRTKRRLQNVKAMFLLGTAYASNIGGTGVITGSATNIIALNLIRKDAEGATNEECKQFMDISFLDWMAFNIPPMLLNTFATWLYLQLHFLGPPSFLRRLLFWQKSDDGAAAGEALDPLKQDKARLVKKMEGAIKRKYEELGPMNFQQLATFILFMIMVILWVFKSPQFMPGWDVFFKRTAKGKSFVGEATPTLGIVVLLFALPSKKKYYRNIWKEGNLGEGMKDTLLNWDFVFKKFPWGIFILLGGGSAMALGAKESGLNKLIGKTLEANSYLQACPDALLLALVLIMLAILTAIVSNTACAAILTPVLLGLSYAKNTHPLYLAMAAATTCSYAFALPVSTPPNALVYASSPDLKLRQMVLPGIAITILTVVILFACTESWGRWYFNFDAHIKQCENMTLITSGTFG